MRVLSNSVSVEMDKATFEHHVEFLRRVVNGPQISNNKVTCIMNLVDWEEFVKISTEQEDVWIHRMNLTPHVVPASGKLPTSGDKRTSRCDSCCMQDGGYHCWHMPCHATERCDGKEVYFTYVDIHDGPTL